MIPGTRKRCSRQICSRGRELDLAVKAFTGMNFKKGLSPAKLVKINPAAEEFYYLLRNAFRAALT